MQNRKEKCYYKLVISYVGTDYCGWIQQPGKRSVLTAIEEVFRKIFKHDVTLLGASKTDAGVHAHGQVVRLVTDLSIQPDNIMYALNNALPEPIALISCTAVSEQFHPHHNVIKKEYWYQMSDQRPSPFMSPQVALSGKKIDMRRLQDALCLFVGTHDFALFYTGNDRNDTMRTIDQIAIEYCSEFNGYRVVVEGKKFLRHMIRRILGAAVWYATDAKHSLHVIKKALRGSPTKEQLPTAPAKGLILHKIVYRGSNEKDI